MSSGESAVAREGPARGGSHDRGTSRSWLAVAALVLWFGGAMLLALTEIQDRDLGFHIAWGRLLLEDFGAARSEALGQSPAMLDYAYSYWLYQIATAALYDHLGSWGIVIARAAVIAGTLLMALWIARRMGASLRARALGLAFGVLVSFERFTDRPDVVSHLLWMTALYLLVLHRRERRIWFLVPLQILWVNTHLYYSLLPAAVGAFLVGDWLDARLGRPERAGRGSRPSSGAPAGLRRLAAVFGAVVLATLLNPSGPGAWATQLQMVSFLSGESTPFTIRELVGPYSAYHPFFSLWIYRIGLPLCLVALVIAWRRFGTGLVLAVLIPVVLSLLARRAMSLFGVTAIALLPVAWDALLSRLGATGRSKLEPVLTALILTAGALGSIGLANGRIYLAQDKDLRFGAVHPPRFPAMQAARFLEDQGVVGPVLHPPTAAGAILMANGLRLQPFIDTRFLGTDEANADWLALTRASDAQVPELWDRVQARHGFQTLMLDFYEAPALLRHISASPSWMLVHLDPNFAVYSREGGPNEALIEKATPRLRASMPRPSPARSESLAVEVVRFLESAPPSPLARVEFPWDAFRTANFALQVGNRPLAQAAYLDLLQSQEGSLHASTHRVDILQNLLWTLADAGRPEAIETLCSVLATEHEDEPARRRAYLMERTRALLALGRHAAAESEAQAIATDRTAGADDRWWAWTTTAAARQASGDEVGAVEALRRAALERPEDPETWRTIGSVLDARLSKPAEALEAYERYVSLGGTNPAVLDRMRELRP